MADNEYKAKISIDTDISETEKNLKELQSLFNSIKKGVSRLSNKVNLIDESDYKIVMETDKSLKNLSSTLNKLYNIAETKNFGDSFDLSSFNKELDTVTSKLYDTSIYFKDIRERASSTNFTKSMKFSPSGVSAYEGLSAEDMRKKADEVLLKIEKNLTSEQRKRIELANEEAKKKQEQVRLAQEEVKQAERLKSSGTSKLDTDIPKLKSDLESLASKYNTMFSTGNFAGLREANSELSSMRNKISELRSIILSLQSRGVDVSGYKESLSNIASGYTSLTNDVSSNMKKRLTSSISSVVSKASSLVKSSVTSLGNFTKKTIQTTGSYMSKLFSNIFSSLKNKVTGIFSGKSTGALNLQSQLRSLTMGYASIYGIVRLMKEAVNLSSQLFEVQNVIDNVFGSSTETINDFCENTVSKFGLTELAAKQMIGVFGGILSASNITGKAQAEMSKNLTAFTGDLASFYNLDFETVNKKLQSGLVGNTSAMRSLGVNMTVANLEAYALSKGITQSYQEMNQATKTTLRYNYMIEQLAVAQGDFSRTSASWSNQIRLLTNNFKQLLSLLGGALIKLLYPVLTLLNEIVSASVKAVTALSKVFGFSAADLSELFGGSGATADVSDYASDLEDVADATDDVADATKNANDNLQSFDKLNNITKPTTTNKTSKSTDDTGESLIDPISYYNKIKDVKKTTSALTKFLDELWDAIKDRDFEKAGKIVASGINSIVSSIRGKLNDPKLFKSIDKFMDYFTDFVVGFLDELDSKEIGRAIQDFVYTIAYTINSAFDNAMSKDLFRKLGNKIADFFNGLFDDPNQWYEIGKALTTGIRSAFEVLAGFLEKADPVSWGISFKNFFLGAIDRLFGDGGAETIGNDLAELMNTAFELLISTFGDGKIVQELSDGIVRTINTAIEGIDKEDLAGAFTTVIKNISTILKSISSIDTDTLVDDVAFTINSAVDSGAVSDLVEGISSVLLKLVDVAVGLVKEIDWTNLIKSVWEGLRNAFESQDEEAKKTVETILGLLVTVKTVKFVWNVKSATSGLSNVLTLLKAVKTAGSGVASAFGSIVTSAAGLTTSGVVMTLGTLASSLEQVVSASNMIDFSKDINKEQFNMLFDADNLVEYNSKLLMIDNAYKNLSGSVEDYESYLNTMKSLGMETTEEYKRLSDALNSYNEAGWFGQTFNSSYLLEMEDATADMEAKVTQTFNSIKNLSSDTVSSMEKDMSNLTTGVWSTEQLEEMYSLGSDTVNSYKDGFESGVAGVSKTLDDFVKNTTSDAKETSASEGKSIGGNIIDGIGEGVGDQGKQNGVLSTITGFINNMVTWFTTNLGIHSPSRVFKSLAMYIPEGIAVGIEDGSKNAVYAINDMCSNLSNEFENSEIDTSSLINTDKFSGMFENVYSEADILLDTLKSKFSGVSDLFNVTSEMVVTPKVKQSELNALISQQSSNNGVVNTLGALYSKLNSLSSSADNNRYVHVDVYLDKNNKLESFILDTVNGDKIRTGGF